MQRIFLFVILGISAIASTIQAQNFNDKSFYYDDFNPKFYYESHVLPSLSTDSIRVLVLFRVRNDILTFTSAKPDEMAKGAYIALPVLYVELMDNDGIIRQNKQWRDTVFASNYEKTSSKKDFIWGAVLLSAERKKYSVSVEFGDRATPRSFKMKDSVPESKFQEGNRRGGTPQSNFFARNEPNTPDIVADKNISQPLFAMPQLAKTPDEIFPFVLQKNIPFGTDTRVIISLLSTKKDNSYSYLIRKATPEKRDNVLGYAPSLESFADIAGEAKAESNRLFDLVPNDNHNRILLKKNIFVLPEKAGEPPAGQPKKTDSTDDNPKPGLLDFMIPTSTMEPGRYVISVYQKGSSDTIRQNFSIIWVNMPLSLRNLQYASELMKYTVADSLYDEITSGSREERRKKFYDFWKAKDPTPGTSYNEMLSEYFARVDYAFFNFQTIAEKDGAKTERGKICILYGIPTSIETKMEPNQQPQEVWRYDNNVKKEFIFESKTAGIYILKKIIDL